MVYVRICWSPVIDCEKSWPTIAEHHIGKLKKTHLENRLDRQLQQLTYPKVLINTR